MQNNKSVKAPFTCDVRKNTVLGVGKFSTQFCLMLYLPLYPTPCTVFSVHHSQQCFNIYIYGFCAERLKGKVCYISDGCGMDVYKQIMPWPIINDFLLPQEYKIRVCEVLYNGESALHWSFITTVNSNHSL